ncbi:carbon storage regulator [Burkholderia sp. F1]|uniref:carbon storage regulator n=1 Tax=Burkholderia sp. F1 TaxID=3366817 RepID=UPI003D71DAC8
MSHLVLSRSLGQVVRLFIDSDEDDEALLHKLRTDGIVVIVAGISRYQVKLGFIAPKSVVILREELLDDG